MKGINIFITIFLLALTTTLGLFFLYSFSTANLKINGFSGNLDENGFWLNPRNINISGLTEEDVYIGNITTASQTANGELVLGITSDSGVTQTVQLPKKLKKGTVYTLSPTDIPGDYTNAPAPDSAFYDSIKKVFDKTGTQKIEICLSKQINEPNLDYDYICRVAIYL